MKSQVVKNPSPAPCPITIVAQLLSDTWTILIMHAFIDHPDVHPELRFCELERKLPGISTRTLTNKLKILESSGLLIKNDSGTYSATNRGIGLRIIEDAMRHYALEHLSGEH